MILMYNMGFVYSSNSTDDNGLLVGNWTSDFTGGYSPTKWVGSSEILQKFWKKRKSVKFAQCWVFAGSLTAGKK